MTLGQAEEWEDRGRDADRSFQSEAGEIDSAWTDMSTPRRPDTSLCRTAKTAATALGLCGRAVRSHGQSDGRAVEPLPANSAQGRT